MPNSTLTNDELKTILENHHTGMVLLMPGNPDNCPGKNLIQTKQPIQFGMNGCRKCMMYALRATMDRYPDFKTVVVDALNKNFQP